MAAWRCAEPRATIRRIRADSRTAAVALLVGGLILACRPASPGPPPVEVTLSDSLDGVPPSSSADVLLLASGIVCTTDSYLFAVRCYDPDTGAWTVLGREGPGPGELRSVAWLVRVEADDSAVGVVDLRNHRLTTFHLSGGYRSDFPLPPLFRPASPLRPGGLTGLWTPYTPTDGLVGRLVRLAPGDGHVLSEIVLREEARAGEAIGFLRGTVTPDGTVVIHIENHRFGRYDTEGREVAAFAYPPRLQQPILPSDRDLAEFRVAARQVFGVPPSDREMLERASTPLHPVLGQSSLRIGPGGTLWVASARGRVTESFLDIFLDDRFLGSVRVRGRLLAFDLSGGTLLTLVERQRETDQGFVRGFDWYHVALTDAGRSTGPGP